MDTSTTIGALLGSRTIYEKLNTQLDRLDYFSYEGIQLLDVMSGTLPGILYRADTLTTKLSTMTDELEDTPQKLDHVFGSLDNVFGHMNGTMDSLSRMVGNMGGIAVRGEEALQNANDLMEGISNMWIVRRSMPNRDSVPFVAEDAW
jgi:phospholipid/cholesterol/gamma-HCH transport system substrate-binding protein